MVKARHLFPFLLIPFLFNLPGTAKADPDTAESAGTTRASNIDESSRLEKVSKISVAAYNPGDRSQCPNGFRGAWNHKVGDGDIAVSRDLLRAGVKPGDEACIDFGDWMHCGIIRDKMHKRYRKHADLAIFKGSLAKSKKLARAFGRKRGTLYIREEFIRSAESVLPGQFGQPAASPEGSFRMDNGFGSDPYGNGFRFDSLS